MTEPVDLRFNYIVAGTAEAEVGDERGVVTAGDLAVIPAMVPHDWGPNTWRPAVAPASVVWGRAQAACANAADRHI